ncbi:MAG TPA: hypothetical protein VJV78_09430 [Polyangiales bacterium]|nr:hypothetical protein [Polyangiales bacterium]
MTRTSFKVPRTSNYPRDAIIVLPGLVPVPGTTLGAVAQRLAVALDNNAPSPATFRVADEHLTKLGSRELRVVTILRSDSAAEEPVPFADLIEFDYRSCLMGDLATSSPIRQAFAVGATLLFNARNLVAALCRPSQRISQSLQVLYGAFMFSLVIMYFGVLAYTALGTIVELAAKQTSAAASLSAIVPPYLQTSIVVVTFAGLWSRLNLKAMLATIAPVLSCTMDYLAAGRRRSEILGELTRLIDHLDEQTDTPYGDVHFLGYSFGTIVAIDALFPRENTVGLKMKRIDTLITVGCPFDFVRTYWPSYFKARHAATGAPRRWLNVYCELDVFGSNFLDEERPSRTRLRGIEVTEQATRRPDDPDNLAFGPRAEEGGSFGEYLRFIGFRTHSAYWDRESDNALSCFEPIVQKLYERQLAA